MDNVIEIENFITPEYCSALTQRFDDYNQYHFDFENDRKILRLDPLLPTDILLKTVCYSITRTVQDVAQNFYLVPDYQEIVRWVSGSFCSPHTDFDHQKCSSILYLNDDFGGGETVINEVSMLPKNGKLLIFNGAEMEHSVNTVTSGVRFVLLSWFV